MNDDIKCCLFYKDFDELLFKDFWTPGWDKGVVPVPLIKLWRIYLLVLRFLCIGMTMWFIHNLLVVVVIVVLVIIVTVVIIKRAHQKKMMLGYKYTKFNMPPTSIPDTWFTAKYTWYDGAPSEITSVNIGQFSQLGWSSNESVLKYLDVTPKSAWLFHHSNINTCDTQQWCPLIFLLINRDAQSVCL